MNCALRLVFGMDEWIPFHLKDFSGLCCRMWVPEGKGLRTLPEGVGSASVDN